MKRAAPQRYEVAAPDTTPEFDDDDDCKDVYWPDFDMVPGESETGFRLRHALVSAGYERVRIEEASTHPVWVIRAIRASARRITDHRLLLQHFQVLLRGAGFRLRRNELTVSQTGDRILAAFPSGKPKPDIGEILREPQEDLVDYEDMPL